MPFFTRRVTYKNLLTLPYVKRHAKMGLQTYTDMQSDIRATPSVILSNISLLTYVTGHVKMGLRTYTDSVAPAQHSTFEQSDIRVHCQLF